jgi:N-acetylmuramoyl-L-alanine amidase
MFCLLSIILVLVSLILAPSLSATNVYNKLVKLSSAKITEKNGHLKLVLDFAGRPFVHNVNSGKENVKVYDFSPAVFPEIRRETLITLPHFTNVVIAQNDNKTVRLTVTTDGIPLQFSSGLSRGEIRGTTSYILDFSLKEQLPVEEDNVKGKDSFLSALKESLNALKESNKTIYGSSVAEDFGGGKEGYSASVPYESQAYTGRRWTVVIDPGHGGKDPGALGIKANEKDVVLPVAFEVVRELNKIPFINVIMTRTKDEFVRLRDRSALAEKHKADLFVSLHCNSSLKKKSSGFEVYTLSRDGASDKVALEVAYKENSVIELENNGAEMESTPMLNQILCSMMMTDTMNQSILLAGYIGKEAKKLANLEYRGHKNANFYVLRTLKIPAVLVEMGFVSNDEENGLMVTKKWRIQMAQRLAGGIRNYLNHVMMREGEFEDLATSDYYVKRGDTLGGIARQYRTSVSNIVRLNSIGDGSSIQAGQTIKVPGDPVARLLLESTQ